MNFLRQIYQRQYNAVLLDTQANKNFRQVFLCENQIEVLTNRQVLPLLHMIPHVFPVYQLQSIEMRKWGDNYNVLDSNIHDRHEFHNPREDTPTIRVQQKSILFRTNDIYICKAWLFRENKYFESCICNYSQHTPEFASFRGFSLKDLCYKPPCEGAMYLAQNLLKRLDTSSHVQGHKLASDSHSP